MEPPPTIDTDYKPKKNKTGINNHVPFKLSFYIRNKNTDKMLHWSKSNGGFYFSLIYYNRIPRIKYSNVLYCERTKSNPATFVLTCTDLYRGCGLRSFIDTERTSLTLHP